jgi:hypothetical protein
LVTFSVNIPNLILKNIELTIANIYHNQEKYGNVDSRYDGEMLNKKKYVEKRNNLSSL